MAMKRSKSRQFAESLKNRGKQKVKKIVKKTAIRAIVVATQSVATFIVGSLVSLLPIAIGIIIISLFVSGIFSLIIASCRTNELWALAIRALHLWSCSNMY